MEDGVCEKVGLGVEVEVWETVRIGFDVCMVVGVWEEVCFEVGVVGVWE